MSRSAAIVFWPRHVGFLPISDPARQPGEVPRWPAPPSTSAPAALRLTADGAPLAHGTPVAFSLRRKQSTMRSSRLKRRPRPAVVFRKHAGDADERQRPLALAGVQVAVAARHLARREVRRLRRRVREDLEAPADVVRQLRIVERRVGQRILGNSHAVTIVVLAGISGPASGTPDIVVGPGVREHAADGSRGQQAGDGGGAEHGRAGEARESSRSVA